MISFSSNPEFKRYAWLDLNISRLGVMWGIIGLIYLFQFTLNSAGAQELYNTSMLMFHGLVSLWGAREVSKALVDEVNEKTWDRLRMTSLSPEQLTLGKLFGPAFFQWAGGLAVWIIAAIAALFTDHPLTMLLSAFSGLLLAVILNMTAFMSGIYALNAEQVGSFSNRKIRSGFFIPLVLVILLGFTGFSTVLHWPVFSELFYNGHGHEAIVQWYVLSMMPALAQLAVFIFYIFWLYKACLLSMRKQLLYENRMNSTWAFIALNTFLLAGFGFQDSFSDKEVIWAMWTINFIFLLVLNYGLLFINTENYPSLRKIFGKGGFLLFQPTRHHMPAWVPFAQVLVLFVALGLVLALFVPIAAMEDSSIIDDYYINETQGLFNSSLILIGIAFLRDFYMVKYLYYFSEYQRKQLAVVVYFGLFYGLLPGLFAAAELRWIFIPSFADSSLNWGTTISLGLQAIVALWLFVSHYRRYAN